MLKGADGPASASPAIKSTELIQSRRCCPRFAVSLFPSYRPHTEALGSSPQIRCVYPSCWRYRVASKSASKAARITQMLRRIVRNLWRRGIGSCLSQLKRELSPWLEFGLIPANLSDPSKGYFAPTFPSFRVGQRVRITVNPADKGALRWCTSDATVAFTGPGPSSPLAGIGGMSPSPAGSSKRGDYP